MEVVIIGLVPKTKSKTINKIVTKHNLNGIITKIGIFSSLNNYISIHSVYLQTLFQL